MIELDQLLGLVLGELSAEEATPVEEHILSCATCAATVERLIALGDSIGALARAGKVRYFVGDQLLARLEREGLVTRTYRLAPGGSAACTVDASDLYAAIRLQVDLSGVGRLDLVRRVAGSDLRTDDVPFDREQGVVCLVERADYLRTLPSGRRDITLLAVDDAGEHELARYTLDHTAFRP